MEAYTKKFRSQVLVACVCERRDQPWRAVGFPNLVRRINKQRRETGRSRRRPTPTASEMATWLIGMVPRSTRGPTFICVNCKPSSRRKRREGLSANDLQPAQRWTIAKKKTLIASEQDRPESRKANQWRASQEQIDPDQVVFIDETWAKTT